jgi:hypothetical protein
MAPRNSPSIQQFLHLSRIALLAEGLLDHGAVRKGSARETNLQLCVRAVIREMDTLVLPPSGPGKSNETWTAVQSVVVTGANGSGKTRFGVWIEENNTARPVHRIAAQRALYLPDLASLVPYERATAQLYYGRYEPTWNDVVQKQQKLQARWGGQPALQMLSDYEFVIAALFADEARRNRDYAIAARNEVPNAIAPDCKLDILQRIWSTVFPHRELVIGPDKITARIPANAQEYAGRMMSDGERVALYLLGQVLCAPPRAVIVIDEPEIHLHRAIQASLWDRAEASRPDCIFVYVTHDLEFAGSRSGARKIWTKSFDGNCWEWQEVESSTELPDELVLQVLGSRRPVIFVEGDANSYDSTLYRALYPDRLILPMSSCRRVIGARRAMRELRSFHNLDIEGVIDRDHRSDEEIGALRSQGLIVADVAEVENLFCVPGALTAAAKQLNVSDTHAAVQAAEARVISELQKMTDSQIAARAIAELQFKLGGFGPKAGKASLSTIQADLANHVANLDVAEVFKKSTSLFEGIIERKDYDSALRYYNCKGITSFVASTFGLKADTYCTMVTGIVRSEEGAPLAGEMRSKIS